MPAKNVDEIDGSTMMFREESSDRPIQKLSMFIQRKRSIMQRKSFFSRTKKT